jgi:hypothetical protein
VPVVVPAPEITVQLTTAARSSGAASTGHELEVENFIAAPVSVHLPDHDPPGENPGESLENSAQVAGSSLIH